MELLYELESQADALIVERMRRTIADALSRYKPMRQDCDVAMARRHCYERTLITKYGEMRLDISGIWRMTRMHRIRCAGFTCCASASAA